MSAFRYSVKSLLRTPSFTVGAILTFGLGIGLNIAVFSAVDRVLFRSLPYDDPERLVVMNEYRAGTAGPSAGMPAAFVLAARKASGVEELTLTNWGRYSYRIAKEPYGARYFEFVPMAHTALRTLGVRPLVGRDFTEEDSRLKRRRVLITYRMWQRQFGGRDDVVGQSLYSSAPGAETEIAGVLPDDFIPPQLLPSEPWSGIAVTWQILDDTTPSKVFAPPFIRLKPGTSLVQAQTQIDLIAAKLGPTLTKPGVPLSKLRLEPLREVLLGRYTTYVALTFVAATMVLMVACANLASLMLVRARSREGAAAIRLALGATRAHLMQQAIAEGLLLAGSGCAVALVVLRLASEVIRLWLPPVFSTYLVGAFELRVLVFSIAIATASAIIVGALPGWLAFRADLLTTLQGSSLRTGPNRLLGMRSLVTMEVAFSSLLVLGAILMGRTLVNVKGLDVGFDPDNLFTVSAPLSASDSQMSRHEYQEMMMTLSRIPAVRVATAGEALPMLGTVSSPVRLGSGDGQRCPVTEGFLETLGMRLIAGRTFTAEEVHTTSRVGILSVEALEFMFPGADPREAIGRFLDFPGESPRELIGVVSDVRHQHRVPSVPALYVPMAWERPNSVIFALRMSPGHTLTAGTVATELNRKGLAPRTITVSAVSDQFGRGLVDQTFRARLFGGFGMVALILAVIGIYAVQSFCVLLRRRELGIRAALGASHADLVRQLLRESMQPVVVGLGLGLAVATAAFHGLQSFVYGVSTRDPLSFVAVAAIFILVAGVAVWVPTRRASRLDPATILKTT